MLRISALNVYPVKGCRGIPLERAQALVTGLSTDGVRDREWMIVDRRKRFITQRERPRMALICTAVDEGSLTLSADGIDPMTVTRERSASHSDDVTVWRSNVRGIDEGDEAAQWISDFIGADLRLVRFDDAKPRMCNRDFVGDSGAHTLFADGYPLLVVGQGSLDDLNARLAAKGEPALPMNRFRPSVVIDGLDPYDEDHIDQLAIADVTLKLVKPCARCKVTTTDQSTARVGIEPLPTLSLYRRDDALAAVLFGMNAIVVEGSGSELGIGDSVTADYRF